MVLIGEKEIDMAEYNYLNGSFNLYGNKKQNKKAIMDIQSASGVKADGVWGPDSKNAYSNMFGDPTVVSNVVQQSAPTVNASHETIGGFGGLGTASNNGYSYAPQASDIYTGSDFSKLTNEQQSAFASQGGTIGDTGNMIPGNNYQAKEGGSGFLGSLFGSDPKPTFSDYSSSGGTMTEPEWMKTQNEQRYVDNQQFNNYAGLGLGAAQLGASLYSTFGANGSMAMNKKNMELMDGQIANNNDIMSTRKARAADIAKYFG